MRLWADVPQTERVTEAFLRSCAGGADQRWLADKLARISKPRCQAAVRWGGRGDLWNPCGRSPSAGESFCVLHGGAYTKRPTEAQKRWRRVERCLIFLDREIGRLQREMAELQRMGRYLKKLKAQRTLLACELASIGEPGAAAKEQTCQTTSRPTA